MRVAILSDRVKRDNFVGFARVAAGNGIGHALLKRGLGQQAIVLDIGLRNRSHKLNSPKAQLMRPEIAHCHLNAFLHQRLGSGGYTNFNQPQLS